MPLNLAQKTSLPFPINLQGTLKAIFGFLVFGHFPYIWSKTLKMAIWLSLSSVMLLLIALKMSELASEDQKCPETYFNVSKWLPLGQADTPKTQILRYFQIWRFSTFWKFWTGHRKNFFKFELNFFENSSDFIRRWSRSSKKTYDKFPAPI